MTAADKKKLNSINENSCGVNVVKFQWPATSGEMCEVNFAELGIKDTDFICPVLDLGQGYFEMLPWQILSVEALFDTGELYSTYKNGSTLYNLCIGIACGPGENESDPPTITGAYIFWNPYQA